MCRPTPGMRSTCRKARRHVVKKLNEGMVKAMGSASVKERLQSLGAQIVAPDRRTPDYLGKFTESEIEKWEAPIKRAASRSSSRLNDAPRLTGRGAFVSVYRLRGYRPQTHPFRACRRGQARGPGRDGAVERGLDAEAARISYGRRAVRTARPAASPRTRLARTDWRCSCRRCRGPTMLRLGDPVVRAGIERSGEAEAAGNLRGLVGEDVAIHISGDDDVERAGVAHQQRGHGVDDAFFVCTAG